MHNEQCSCQNKRFKPNKTKQQGATNKLQFYDPKFLSSALNTASGSSTSRRDGLYYSAIANPGTGPST